MADPLVGWLDAACKVFGSISNRKGGNIRSYRVFEKNEIPAALELSSPCAVTYVQDVSVEYVAGGIDALNWGGMTELHITPVVDPSLLADVMWYFTGVLNAMKANHTLGGRVQWFRLPESEKSIRIIPTTYGQGPAHYALVVTWEVRENVALMLSG